MWRWLVTNAEARRRENKTNHRSRIRSTKWGFVKKNVGGFRYKPRGDWFCFAKVRKLCFLCSCKQTLVFARLTRMRYAYESLSWMRVWQLVEVQESCLYRFKYWFFFYQNTLIRYRRHLFTPLSCVRYVLIWMDALYSTTFGLLNKNTHPCHYKAWKSMDNF